MTYMCSSICNNIHEFMCLEHCFGYKRDILLSCMGQEQYLLVHHGIESTQQVSMDI